MAKSVEMIEKLLAQWLADACSNAVVTYAPEAFVVDSERRNGTGRRVENGEYCHFTVHLSDAAKNQGLAPVLAQPKFDALETLAVNLKKAGATANHEFDSLTLHEDGLPLLSKTFSQSVTKNTLSK